MGRLTPQSEMTCYARAFQLEMYITSTTSNHLRLKDTVTAGQEAENKTNLVFVNSGDSVRLKIFK